MQRVSTRNARFQQWEALLSNRTKRQRQRAFLVQGVRPISAAVTHGWQVRELLQPLDGSLSQWARDVVRDAPEAESFGVSPDLLQELGGKDDGPPELLAVVGIPEDDLSRIPVTGQSRAPLVVVLERPGSPGNLGTVVRSADALGATGVVVTGHAADVYDPKSVRAGRGSLFALPVVRVPAFSTVQEWAAATGAGFALVGTDENGSVNIDDTDLTGPRLLVVGNETTGMSEAARAGCDVLARIPMDGSATSLNAATAATVVLYEAARQRRTAEKGLRRM